MTPPFRKYAIARHRPAPGGRHGFTLVEILVVILIIAIMASLITAVIGNSLNSARAAATRATITKVHRLLEERQQAIARSNLRTEIRVIRTSMTTPGLNRNDVARIVALKEATRAHLPQRIEDLYGPDKTPNNADDSPVLVQLRKLNSSFQGNTPKFPAKHYVNLESKATASSELLYVALTMGTELGSEGSVIEFNSREAMDTDGDGLMELVDGWGKPLRFYRWPTSLVLAPSNSPTEPRPVELLIGGGNAQMWNKDPDDPVDRFQLWMANSNVSNHPQVSNWFHAPATYHIPLIVSPGQDGQLGLEEPNDLGRGGIWARLYDEDTNGNGTLDSGEDRNNNGELDNLIQNSTRRIFLADNITNRNISIGGN